MEEQTVQVQPKRKRRLPGWVKIVLTVVLTLMLSGGIWCALLGPSGLAMVETYLLARFAFVDTDADLDGATDAALKAFVKGLEDRWSYYNTAEEYQNTLTRRANNYVGVGVTVSYEREEGLCVQSVSEGGPADRKSVV